MTPQVNLACRAHRHWRLVAQRSAATCRRHVRLGTVLGLLKQKAAAATRTVPPLLAALLVVLPLATRAGPVQRAALVVDGISRAYELHVPDGAALPMPLVIMFHGHGGAAASALEQGDWVRKSMASGFAVVALEGTRDNEDRRASLLGNPRSWNAGENTGSSAQRRGVDDVGFVRALIDDLVRRRVADPARVYATGMSNGAGMAFRIGLELSDRVAAIAPVANSLLVPPRPLQRPVSLLLIWGTADPLNPIDGGRVKRTGGYVLRPSANEAWQAWRALLHCPGEPATEPLAKGVSLRAYRGCDAGSSAEFISIEGMGHQWPGGQVYVRMIAGPGSDALNATDRIWSFFRAQSLGR